MKKLYEVQTRFQSGWYNDWFKDDNRNIPRYFESREEAWKMIDDLIESSIKAVEMGNMEKPFLYSDYRIRLAKIGDTMLHETIEKERE